MSKSIKPTFVLYKPVTYVFSPGENITGQLILNLQRNSFFEGIEIIFEGLTFNWEQSRACSKKVEEFFKLSQYVFGGITWEGNSRKLTAGVHRFPFKFIIPQNAGLPGSFQGKFGYVKYQLQARIQTSSSQIPVKSCERTIYFNGEFLLLESALKPITYKKINSSLLGRKSRLGFILYLPQRGFTSGTEIPFGLHVIHPYVCHVISVSISLFQRIHYKANELGRHAAKMTETQITSISKRAVELNLTQAWNDSLKLPDKLIPTVNAGLILIEYIIKVEFNIFGSGSAANLQGEVQVLIGSFPTDRLPIESGVQRDQILTQRRSSTSSNFGRTGAESEAIESSILDSQFRGFSTGVPPSYSTLSFPYPRSFSLETLPPAYEDCSSGLT